MEDLLMVKKVFDEITTYAKNIKARLVASWGVHLPYRHSLLMSL